MSDRPEDQVDVYHTFFGLAGLSLMGRPGLRPIDPTFALPVEVVQRLRERQQQRQADQQHRQADQQQEARGEGEPEQQPEQAGRPAQQPEGQS